MNRITRSLALTLAVLALTACGKSAPPEVAFDTLETARKQAKANAEYNAKAWRAQSTAYTDLALISNGDSTQTPPCPQGDGWASLALVDPTQPNRRVNLKCSTVSDSVGCREEKAFKASPYAGEDNTCQPTSKVPHPLPKIAQ